MVVLAKAIQHMVALEREQLPIQIVLQILVNFVSLVRKTEFFIHPHPHSFLDWRSYKVDGIPELEKHRSTLNNKGLRDPWIRNYAWIYDPKAGAYPTWRLTTRIAFFGVRYAMVALATCLVTEKILEKAFPPFHGHIHLYNPDQPHSDDHDHHHH